MISNILNNYKLFKLCKQNNKFDFCSFNEKPESIFLLKIPKLVYLIDKSQNSSKNSEIIIDRAFIKNINSQKLDQTSINLSHKFDKKNKNNSKLTSDTDSKKNKVRQKKKNRNKINIVTNDIFENNNIISGNKIDTFNLALMRPIKKTKNKKQLKKNIIQDNHLTKAKDSNEIKHTFSSYKIRDDKNTLKKEIIFDGPLTIHQLSDQLSISEASIITWLFLQGISVTINQTVDISIVTKVAKHYNFSIVYPSKSSTDKRALNVINNYSISNGIQRPPIVTIFGHVDHGKTSLINSIKNTHSDAHEIGGITQAIKAYEVNWEYLSLSYKIMFLDTPGHEAFAGMRIRGADVTDIAILLIAADDGLRPQSIEAINHIMSRNIPYIVAINKIDKDNIDIVKIKNQLAKYDILDKEWGGSSKIVEISALNNLNIDLLLSSICEMSQLQGFKANPQAFAEGTIIEGHLDKKMGPTATVVVKNGTLKIGDIIVSGSMYGKVKLIVNTNSMKIKEAHPSSIVQVLGFSLVPKAGLKFYCVDDEKNAKQRVSHEFNNSSSFSTSLNNRVTAENKSSNFKKVNVILKTDTQGSIEAIIHSFSHISQDKVQINLISFSAGSISDKDLDLAVTSNSIILGFNISIANNISISAEKFNILINTFNVIYDLLDYIKEYMLNLVDPEYEKVLIGKAIVQTVFNINKGTVAGCIVQSGKLKKNAYINVYNKDIIIYNGLLNSLKRLKDDVEEVNAGNECGVMCLDYNLWHSLDRIEAYELTEIPKIL